jgi:hypothetical protein
MNQILDTLSADIERAVAIEDELYTLAKESGHAWRLITELSRIHFNAGLAVGGK